VQRSTLVLSTFAAACLAACSSAPKPQSPAPEAAAAPAAAGAPAAPHPSAVQLTLSGDWDIRLGGGGTSTMRLSPRGDGYVGMLAAFEGVRALGEAPPNGYLIRYATLEGNRATIVVDFDGDEGRITATFRGANMLDGSISSRRLQGRITLQRR